MSDDQTLLFDASLPEYAVEPLHYVWLNLGMLWSSPISPKAFYGARSEAKSFNSVRVVASKFNSLTHLKAVLQQPISGRMKLSVAISNNFLPIQACPETIIERLAGRTRTLCIHGE